MFFFVILNGLGHNHASNAMTIAAAGRPIPSPICVPLLIPELVPLSELLLRLDVCGEDVAEEEDVGAGAAPSLVVEPRSAEVGDGEAVPVALADAATPSPAAPVATASIDEPADTVEVAVAASASDPHTIATAGIPFGPSKKQLP